VLTFLGVLAGSRTAYPGGRSVLFGRSPRASPFAFEGGSRRSKRDSRSPARQVGRPATTAWPPPCEGLPPTRSRGSGCRGFHGSFAITMSRIYFLDRGCGIGMTAPRGNQGTCPISAEPTHIMDYNRQGLRMGRVSRRLAASSLTNCSVFGSQWSLRPVRIAMSSRWQIVSERTAGPMGQIGC